MSEKEIAAAREATLTPPDRAAAKLAAQHKLYVRDRIALLVDADTFVEDGQLANALDTGLPADGVVTGQGL
ncbi:MAG: acyl-CoA carboxylase subunit beta, partial [Pseudonocardiales bacterium]|nr:acyl-CoA carboxylase subunit beta [Pseudonocardiales bacterium]